MRNRTGACGHPFCRVPAALAQETAGARVRRVVERWLVALGTLSVLGTLLAFAGERWWLLDLFAHFRPQYLLVLVAGAAVLAWRRRWPGAALFCAAALVNAAMVLPAYLAPRVDAQADLRVVVLNLAAGNRRADLVLPYLREARADVLVLVEFTPFWQAALAPLHAGYPSRTESPSEDPFGMAVFSRLACSACVVEDVAGVPRIRATLARAGADVTVIGAHPPPPINSQLSAARDAYLASTAQAARGGAGPVIVAGDLNVTPWSHAYRLLEGAGLRAGTGATATWPAFLPLPVIPIDHVLVSADVRVAGAWRGPALGSDHYPLRVELVLSRD